MFARKVWCTKDDSQKVVFVEMENESTGKKAIYAAGNAENGCLGLGEKDGNKVKTTETFEKLAIDSEQTQIVDIAAY